MADSLTDRSPLAPCNPTTIPPIGAPPLPSQPPSYQVSTILPPPQPCTERLSPPPTEFLPSLARYDGAPPPSTAAPPATRASKLPLLGVPPLRTSTPPLASPRPAISISAGTTSPRPRILCSSHHGAAPPPTAATSATRASKLPPLHMSPHRTSTRPLAGPRSATSISAGTASP